MSLQKNRALIDQELLAIDGATITSSGVTGLVIDLRGVQNRAVQLYAILKNAVKNGGEQYSFNIELSDDEAFGSTDDTIESPEVPFPGITASESGILRHGFVPNFNFARINPQVSGSAPSADMIVGFAPDTV